MEKYIKSSYKNIFLLVLISIIFSIQINSQCTVCTNKLGENYLIDAWGNKFHAYHEKNAYYCNSCSRLISEALTHGGYKTIDNRYICSLCYPNLIYSENLIEISRMNVLSQLEQVGFTNLSRNIPIVLLDKSELFKISDIDYHKSLKGFTKIDKNSFENDNYTIYILNNLHVIEFEAVLAHEYLHVWQNELNIKLDDARAEGLCNLGSALIYDNKNNQFSKILKTTLYSDDKIYGDGYKNMEKMKNQLGWYRLIKKIKSNYSY